MKNSLFKEEKKLVSFKVAKLLKENGFSYLDKDDSLKTIYQEEDNIILTTSIENNITNPDNFYDAPSYQIVIDWIETKFYFRIVTSTRSWDKDIIKYSVWINELKLKSFYIAVLDEAGDDRQDDPYDTKEEAIETAIIFIFNTLKDRFQKIYKEEGYDTN